MSNLQSIIIVAVLGVIGNIVYFEYQTRKKNSKGILKQRLTKLLLPLYKVLHLEEIKTNAWAKGDNGDPAELICDLPDRILKPIEKIINKNIYLADDQLHKACVDFLIWANGSDSNERYQELMRGSFDEERLNGDFNKFYDIVTREYNKSRHEYLKK